jgi:acetyltransferase-like isoleucine patch superfamily enzyme
MEIFKRFFSKFSSKLFFANRNYTINKMLSDGTLKIGNRTYGIPKIYNYKGSEANIIIGNFTSIAPEVTLITGGIHPIKSVSQFPFRSTYKLDGAYFDGNPYTKGDINIGSDVWIGTDVTILSGVKIGDGAIIYNKSLINRDIPPYAIAAGIPAKVIGYRFEDNIIDKLLVIKWWNWKEELIVESVAELTSENINAFINKYYKK